MESKFGGLRRYQNPRPSAGSSAMKTDESHTSYGVLIGADPKRPHCHVLWNFVDKAKHSDAHSVKVPWNPALEAAYLRACEGHLASKLPVFANGLATELTDEPPADERSKSPADMVTDSDHSDTEVETDLSKPANRKSHSADLAADMRAMNNVVSPPSRIISSPPPPLSATPTAKRPPKTAHNTNLAEERRMAQFAAAFDEADRQSREQAVEKAWEASMLETPTEDEALSTAISSIISSIDDESANKLIQSIRRSSRLSNRGFEKILNMSIAAAQKAHPEEQVSAAVDKELGQMDQQDVWKYLTPTALASERALGLVKNIIPCSLFLKVKSDLETLKARLVVHGDKQILSDLFGSNSSPTININILLTVLSVAAKERYDFESVDITGAYLNAPLPEPEYMRLPADLAHILVEADESRRQYVNPFDGSIVVKLMKALYGLKNSGKLWYQELNDFMTEMKFKRSEVDKCLYIFRDGDKVTYALVYVDDILFIGNDATFRNLCKLALVAKFRKITEQPTNSLTFLGMKIQKLRNGDITVDQSTMIADILSEFGVTTTSITPCTTNILNHHSASTMICSASIAKKYRSLNMRLLYLATRTRPDILFPTVVYATRSQNPTMVDYDRLTKIMEYLNGTTSKCLTFKSDGPLRVNAYVDSSFNTHWDAKGHTGFAIFPDFDGSAAIIVKSTKHHSTADSSTEAELMALHEAMKYITWIADVYLELGYETRPIETFQDNKSCITLSSEESINFRGRSKFINRKYFGIYQHLQDGDAILTHLGTESMIADVLTKAIVGEKFRNFTISLMGKPS